VHFRPPGAQTAILLDFLSFFFSYANLHVKKVRRSTNTWKNIAWEIPTPYGMITLVRSHTGELRPRELRPRAVTLFRGSPFPWFPFSVCFFSDFFYLVGNSLSPRPGEFKGGPLKGNRKPEIPLSEAKNHVCAQ
jgi:hypothetical protein